MAEIIRMPKLSDTMTEGVVAAWHKNIGDAVESGELLAEIETDKATMEFESFNDGVLLHIGVPEGGSAPVDSVLAIVGAAGEDFQALLDAAGTSAPAVAAAAPVAAPVAAAPAPVAAAPAPAAVAPVPAAVAAVPAPAPVMNGRVKASPLAKRLAGERGIAKPDGNPCSGYPTDKSLPWNRAFAAARWCHRSRAQRSLPVTIQECFNVKNARSSLPRSLTGTRTIPPTPPKECALKFECRNEPRFGQS